MLRLSAGSPVLPLGSDLFDEPLEAGQTILSLSGKVLNAEDGKPLAGAVLDVWHSDDEGFYDVQEGFRPELSHLGFRAKFVTDAEGNWSFRTVTPKYYPIPNDGPVVSRALLCTPRWTVADNNQERP